MRGRDLPNEDSDHGFHLHKQQLDTLVILPPLDFHCVYGLERNYHSCEEFRRDTQTMTPQLTFGSRVDGSDFIQYLHQCRQAVSERAHPSLKSIHSTARIHHRLDS